MNVRRRRSKSIQNVVRNDKFNIGPEVSRMSKRKHSTRMQSVISYIRPVIFWGVVAFGVFVVPFFRMPWESWMVQWVTYKLAIVNLFLLGSVSIVLFNLGPIIKIFSLEPKSTLLFFIILFPVFILSFSVWKVSPDDISGISILGLFVVFALSIVVRKIKLSKSKGN